jgi:hypothetical protein
MGGKHLTDFNAPPPRAVPLSLRLGVLLGGSRNPFGWMLLGFGLIFGGAAGGPAWLGPVDSAGRRLPASPSTVVGALAIAVLTVIGHGGYMLVRMMG